ncbi:hypothetical protein JX265_008747 [Neoarthrinium moseri]|uniref:Amino acid transporter transmembrane domain-containing protein n=1 Tax=Neoarthrinium moseri TaxID=1658444 RepID=A0A9P9WH85_9PEZI|nr:uncharacterized protein JN550_008777 [Neoarthrinium moseri]KAI1848471.1 hypothetical protein JX266_005777 [Neoarthrinium moseri]KAI1863530.1 hypothetical protein JX265_008747 [Neoarthrinium moseri]KAI1864490.1 hypothetical protein JN550_008777 [Neoarthrinium moseri]
MDPEKCEKPCQSEASPGSASPILAGTVTDTETEVFGGGEGAVNFRNVGWIRAAMFMLKMTFATGVLSLPAALNDLGAVPGAIFILFWGLVNTYMAVLQGEFKLRHPSLHTVADGAEIAALQLSGGSKKWAVFSKEVTEFLYLVSWILCTGLSILGLSIALNAVTHHGTCTVLFAFVSYIVVATIGSIRKIEKTAWVTWVGFISIVAAIMVVLIATAIRGRPAAAPAIGDYELGFSAFPSSAVTFSSAWSASLIIYASSANTSGYVPVISEMRRPQHYFRSVYVTMAWIVISYMVIGMVMYRYAGQWLATPALGSAGPTIKIISYAISIPGLIAGGMICVHISGKSIFVRVLRRSRHLTGNTWQHWTVWLASTYGTGLVGWLICEAIPFYGSLVSIIGSLGFGPLGICLPAVMWFCMHPEYRRGDLKLQAMWWLHVAILCMGIFVTIGGTLANVVVIIGQFRDGSVSGPFQCADNSNTVG